MINKATNQNPAPVSSQCIIHRLTTIYIREARKLIPDASPSSIMLFATLVERPIPVSVRALAKSTTIPHETVRRHLCKMHQAGLLEKNRDRKYIPTAFGLETAERLNRVVLQSIH